MRSPLRTILSSFVLTRLALFAIAILAVLRLPINAVEAQGFHLPPQPHAFLEAWARYDACWFVTIAQLGYRGPIGPWGDMRANFFPLFPALVSAVTPFAGTPMLAGLIVSNVCFLVFLILLWRIVRLDWDPEVARRTMWIYLLFPSSVFLSGAYSESVLLVTTAAALLAARRRCWLLAGLLAGLATLARPLGIFAVVPLVAEYIAASPADESGWAIGPLARILVPAGVAAVGYLIFSTSTFGNPLATLESQEAIRGPMAAPWQPFVDLWREGPQLHTFGNSLVDATLAISAVAALPLIYRRLRPSYAWYACLIVFIPLSGSLISFNRMLLASFPHAILLAASVKRPWVLGAMLVSFAMLEAFTMTAFATWNWIA